VIGGSYLGGEYLAASSFLQQAAPGYIDASVFEKGSITATVLAKGGIVSTVEQ
jgi:hypothetical protein